MGKEIITIFFLKNFLYGPMCTIKNHLRQGKITPLLMKTKIEYIEIYNLASIFQTKTEKKISQFFVTLTILIVLSTANNTRSI